MKSWTFLVITIVVTLFTFALPAWAEFGDYVFVPLQGEPHDVVYDAAQNLAYVSNRSLDRIDVVSLNTMALQPSIPVGNMPTGLAITPDGSQLLATLYNERKMAIVDLNSKTLLKKIALPTGRDRNRPLNVSFDAIGTCIWRDGGPANPFGYAYTLDLQTGQSTRLFPTAYDCKYSLSHDGTLCLFMFEYGRLAIWDRNNQTEPPIVIMPGLGGNWTTWISQGLINDSHTAILLSRAGFETRAYDGNLNYLDSLQGLAWGTFGPWDDLAIIVEAEGDESASNRISLIDTVNLSTIDTLQLSEWIGIEEYNYGSLPIFLSQGGETLFAVGQTGLFIIDTGESATPANLESLEITGPNEVREDVAVQFSAIAHYDSGRTKNVTAKSEWLVNPDNFAQINNGLLNAQSIYPQQQIALYAEYCENETTVQAEKSVTLTAICGGGHALEFDGENDFLSVANVKGLANFQNPQSELTITAWVKQTNQDFYWDTILASEAFRLQIKDRGKLYWGLNGFNNSGSSPESNGSLELDEWYYIAVSKKGGVIKFYINGMLDSVADISGTAKSINSLRIGKDGISNLGSDDYFTGSIDDVSIWNIALPDQKIAYLMNNKATDNEAGLVAYWTFDEGSGQVVYDSSPSGNQGYLGSNQNGPDDADPAWVVSNTVPQPCTEEELIERNLTKAIEIKTDTAAQLGRAMMIEMACSKMFNDISKQSSLWNKKQILTARTKITVAMIHEIIARGKILGSLQNLNQTMEILFGQSDSEEKNIQKKQK